MAARDVTPKNHLWHGRKTHRQRGVIPIKRNKFLRDTLWLYFSAFLMGWIGGAIWMLWLIS